MLRRILYFGYYLKQIDKEKFSTFLAYTENQTSRSKNNILLDMLTSIFRYNISILEYFQFRYVEKSSSERDNWAGTGYMYEYQLRMNPKAERHILDDKTFFYKNYGEFFVHHVADINDLKNDAKLAAAILANPSAKIVFKVADGKCGNGVLIRNADEFTQDTLIDFMVSEKYDLVEEFLIQHPDLNRLSPSAVNTVRIFTQLNDNDEVDLLGCRLRISVNSSVDNMAAGNLAAPIDDFSGKVIGPGVYSDITKSDESIHPVTGFAIEGFQIPFWSESVAMVKEAALKHPQNRSIGWDVVITDRGPGLIEGNHDWCKLLWQLPVKDGLKHLLIKYNT